MLINQRRETNTVHKKEPPPKAGPEDGPVSQGGEAAQSLRAKPGARALERQRDEESRQALAYEGFSLCHWLFWDSSRDHKG